nr:putative reverse transcriptase domain-containing protein [Tanacetum cinerariifolium]
MMPTTWPVNWLSKQFRVGLPELVKAIKGNGKTTKETPITITPTTTTTVTETTAITNNKTGGKKLPGPMLQPQLRVGVMLGTYQGVTVATLTIIGNVLQSVKSDKELLQILTKFCTCIVDRIMPPQRLRKKSVKKLVKRRVDKAIEKYEKTRADSINAGGSGSVSIGGSADVQGCSYKTFMNCKPYSFNGIEGVVGLKRWFKKIEQVFEICKCTD